ncbi:MAG: TrkH family potassium uptake protein [Treponema sp.]|nr:TrkH family potassium uptake protein [Treponema sp.]
MKRLAVFRLLAVIIGGVLFFMIPPLVMAVVLGESAAIRGFLIPLAAGLVLVLSAVFGISKTQMGIRPRDGFLLVFLSWIIASLIGALPYWLSGLELHFSDAIFESTCGFTATGASTFTNVESLPRSILLWRSSTHWAGGMGIVLLTVALLPLLGVGGFQLVKAEMPGPEKEKMTPRVTAMAKILWSVYCVFTVILILLYKLGGMDWFDAVCNSFMIIATGGPSTKNGGLASYHSPFIEWVTTIFMLLGALNFNLYFRLVRGKFRDFVDNTEIRAFFAIFAIGTLIISLSILPKYGSFGEALRLSAFQTSSYLSSTGNSLTDYTAWPALAQGVLFCLMFIGGCTASTAGGIKVIRWTVLFKQAINELRRIIFPQGIFSIQLNKKVGRKDVVYGVAGFIFLYFFITAFATLVTASAGYDPFTSLTASLSMIGNIGSGFGLVGPAHTYNEFPVYIKLLFSLLMIVGRLELWGFFVLLTPEYWRR